MDSLIIIYCVISLFILICFLRLCYNVAVIKKQTKILSRQIDSQDYWLNEFRKNQLLNRPEAAIFALEELIWLKLKDAQGDYRKQIYAEMKEKYESVFIKH